MMKQIKGSLWVLLLSGLSIAQSATPIDQTQIVSASKALASMVPPAATLTVTTAGTYTLTLSDVQKTGPGAAFSSLSVVVSQGSQLIKHLALPTALATTSASVTLAAGQYQVQVLGVTPSVSQYGVDLKNASNVSVWSDSAVVSAPPTNNFSNLQQALNLTAGQSYTVTLSDRVFPTALTDLQATIVQGSNPPAPVCQITAVATSATCTFTASASGNQLVVLASVATGGAGLYSVKVSNDTSGAIAYGATLPLGTMPDPVSVTLPAVDTTYSLSSFDFLNPSALSSFKLALVQGAEMPVKQIATGGPAAFNGTTGAASLYVIATAATSSAGQYSVLIKRGTNTVASVVNSVTDTISTGLEGYVFKATLPVAGSYTLQLRDFVFPQAFATLSASVSRDGGVLGTLSAPGPLTITGASGDELSIAVLAKPGAAAVGLFGVSLANGSAAPLLEKTQGVGGSFTSQDVTVAAADHFLVTATDFAAPVALSQQRVAISRGPNLIGSIFGGGTFGFDATPGTYTLSFITTAQGSPGYGMYGVSIATAPAVTLSTNAASVASGGSATLTWSTTDANVCTASGGWSGNKATSGTATAGPLSADTTFTLTCAGAGGNTAKSTTVSIQVAAASSGGGGGTESLLLLLTWTLLAAGRQLRARGD